jgi:quinoprotein glucose dehydrogenase
MAQDLGRLGGKILRITPEGNIPPDNPFKGSPVWSYGHRNPQGLAWNPEGALFASEHGPSGEFLRFGNDEVNLIRKGGNYGWPKVIGYSKEDKYVNPLALWEKATPPSGMTFYKGSLLGHLRGDMFVATLASNALIRVRLAKAGAEYRPVRVERWFATGPSRGRYGRLRDVVEGPDGALYFLTSNRDGRGEPRPGDDKIYRISPGK